MELGVLLESSWLPLVLEVVAGEGLGNHIGRVELTSVALCQIGKVMGRAGALRGEVVREGRLGAR